MNIKTSNLINILENEIKISRGQSNSNKMDPFLKMKSKELPELIAADMRDALESIGRHGTYTLSHF